MISHHILGILVGVYQVFCTLYLTLCVIDPFIDCVNLVTNVIKLLNVRVCWFSLLYV